MISRGLDVVYFKLFDNCNAKCNMCDCWELPRSRRGISHYEAVLTSVLAAGPRSIRFTGGEPLLFRELPRLIRLAAETGVRVSVISNGRILPRKVSQLAEHGCDEIIVSLDGVGETHDMIRNTPWLFDQVLAGISGINLTRMSYGVNTVVQRQGVRELPRLAKILLAQARPPRWWHLIPVRDRPELLPSDEDITWLHAVLPGVFQEMADGNVEVLADAVMFNQGTRAACQVPQFAVYIDAESGHAYSCNILAYSDPPIGNIVESTMEEVWSGHMASRVRENVAASAHGTCSRCDVASRMMNYKLRAQAISGWGQS
jgi:MoaA/NifB/PqqE/SkfB family radical SAM enzyme